MLTSCTDAFLRLVKAVLLMTFFHILTQSDNMYKLKSGIAVPQAVIPQKYVTESQFLSQKSLQTQVTEVREKWEKADKTKRELRFLSRSTVPKISLSFPSPYPSYFQHNLDKKKYSCLDHLGANFCSILLISTELKTCKEWRIWPFHQSGFYSPCWLIWLLEMFLNNQIWASEKVSHFNPS